MYFIGILENNLITFATHIVLTSKFQVKVHLGLVQTNIFGVILCNLYNVICSYSFCSSQWRRHRHGKCCATFDTGTMRCAHRYIFIYISVVMPCHISADP